MVEIVSFLVATVVVFIVSYPTSLSFVHRRFVLQWSFALSWVSRFSCHVHRHLLFRVFFVSFQEKEKLVLLAADGDVILTSDINLLRDFNHTKIYI